MSEVVAELVVGVVVEPPDGGVLDGAVHAFDLAIGPRMLWLGQPVIDVGEGTGVFESVSSEGLLARDHLADLGWGPGFALGIGEVDAVVGQHRVDLVGTALTRARRKSAAVRVVALTCSAVKANLLVRSMATKR